MKELFAVGVFLGLCRGRNSAGVADGCLERQAIEVSASVLFASREFLADFVVP
jgi:hypothetical protein